MLGERNERTSGRDANLERKWRLLGEAVKGHEEELSAGVRVYIWRFGMARGRASIEALTEEVLQDTAEIALRKLEEYDEGRKLVPWLLGIALNVIRHRLRDEVRRNRVYPSSKKVPQAHVPEQSAEKSTFDPAAESEEEILLNSMTADEVLSLVGENDRQVLRLAYIEGLVGRELAARLAISEGAVHTRLSRARTRAWKAYHGSSEQGLR